MAHRSPRRRRGALASLALLASTSLGPSLAFGPSSVARADGVADEAELHFQRGIDAYREQNYATALEHFLASNRLVPNRNVVYNIARAFERLGRPSDAYRYYVDALEVETDEETRTRIQESLTRLAPEVAIVDVTSSPPGATIYVDRVELGSVGRAPRSLAIPPGRHTILLQSEGYHLATSEPVEAVVGQRASVSLNLTRIVGHVVVEGEEGAEVRVDEETSEPVCVSPCSFDATPGSHVLYFGREGHRSVPRQVTVVADETVTVAASLVAITGSLLVTADESNAHVEVDGRLAGFTPSVIQNVPVGTHTVRVSLSGYQPVDATITIAADQQAEIRNVRLVPLREVQAASRRVEQIEDAPASISIVSQQELQAFQYPTIMEALRGIRGFAVNFDSIYSNAAVRGLGQPNDFNNRLLLLNDGSMLNDNILYQAFIGFDGRVDLGDVDRIEIVRGPGSVLYGTGAVSGVVNLVPQGRDEPTNVSFSTSTFGPVGRLRASFNYRHDEHAGVRASVSAAHSDGYNVDMFIDADGDPSTPPTRSPAHGVDAFNAASTSGRAWWNDVTLHWFYSYRELHIPTGSYDTIFDRPENTYDDQRGQLEIRYEPRINEQVQLLTRAYGNYTHFNLNYLYAATDEVTGADYEQPYVEYYNGAWGGAEARVIIEPIDDFRLSVGGELSYHGIVDVNVDERVQSGGALGPRDPLLSLSNPYLIGAAYAMIDWAPIPQLHISGGARVDIWDQFRPRLVDNSGTPAPDGFDFVSVNPRASVIWRPDAENNLKIMGGRAFRAPTTYEIFYNDGGRTTQPSYYTNGGAMMAQRLSPESFYQGEAEFTHRFDTDWSALVAVNGMYAENFIDTVDVPGEDGVVYYQNGTGGQALVSGELEVRREFRGGWMLAAMYGYLHAQYLQAPNPASFVTDCAMGDTLENCTSIANNRQVTNAPNHFASFRAIVPFIERYVVGALRVSLEAPRRIATDSNATSDAAVVTDFVISGSIPEYGLRYSAGVYNLFDWRYSVPAVNLPANTFQQPGRSFMFSLGLTL